MILTDRYANKTVKIHADRNTKCSFLVTLYLDVPNASMILRKATIHCHPMQTDTFQPYTHMNIDNFMSQYL